MSDVIAVDTSALIAMAQNEPERIQFVRRISLADSALISASNLLEARLVMYGKRQHSGYLLLERILQESKYVVVSQDKDEVDMAYEAFLIYGKGNGHKAQLNFGDLFSYALAKSRGIPLLYKGEDFALTDIMSAV
jgi:ribonuclease VapC